MKNIIKSKSEFQRIYSEGKKFSDNHILICVTKGIGRVAFAAGKKLGTAVIRNRLKRLLRECYRLNSDDIRNDVDIIIMARFGLVNKKLSVAVDSFNFLKKRAGILK